MSAPKDDATGEPVRALTTFAACEELDALERKKPPPVRPAGRLVSRTPCPMCRSYRRTDRGTCVCGARIYVDEVLSEAGDEVDARPGDGVNRSQCERCGGGVLIEWGKRCVSCGGTLCPKCGGVGNLHFLGTELLGCSRCYRPAPSPSAFVAEPLTTKNVAAALRAFGAAVCADSAAFMVPDLGRLCNALGRGALRAAEELDPRLSKVGHGG